jgi:hypothetical protein
MYEWTDVRLTGRLYSKLLRLVHSDRTYTSLASLLLLFVSMKRLNIEIKASNFMPNSYVMFILKY